MPWRRFVAIDPGSVHCGVAIFEKGACVETVELKPQDLFRMMEHTEVDGVVMEEFRLYPWKAKEQTFSPLGTVETIGVVKYLCRKRGFVYVMQSAQIKTPTAAQLNARGVRFRSVGAGPHCRDAELHGWYYLLRRKEQSA